MLMPLGEGIELVLTCAECGALSTDDVHGTDGWSLRRSGSFGLRDICPGCGPKKLTGPGAARHTSNGRSA
jgi:hypothetical protein